jgi:hypothetical protein
MEKSFLYRIRPPKKTRGNAFLNSIVFGTFTINASQFKKNYFFPS